MRHHREHDGGAERPAAFGVCQAGGRAEQGRQIQGERRLQEQPNARLEVQSLGTEGCAREDRIRPGGSGETSGHVCVQRQLGKTHHLEGPSDPGVGYLDEGYPIEIAQQVRE